MVLGIWAYTFVILTSWPNRIDISWRIMFVKTTRKHTKSSTVNFHRLQGLLCTGILCRNNCISSITTNVLTHTNEALPHSTKPPYSLGVCNVATELWTTEICLMEWRVKLHVLSIKWAIYGLANDRKMSVTQVHRSKRKVLWWWCTCFAVDFRGIACDFSILFLANWTQHLQEHFGESGSSYTLVISWNERLLLLGQQCSLSCCSVCQAMVSRYGCNTSFMAYSAFDLNPIRHF